MNNKLNILKRIIIILGFGLFLKFPNYPWIIASLYFLVYQIQKYQIYKSSDKDLSTVNEPKFIDNILKFITIGLLLIILVTIFAKEFK